MPTLIVFHRRGMLMALFRRAERGVDVRMCLPGQSDIPIIRRAARAEYAEWLARGVRVWEYQGTVMHAKYAGGGRSLVCGGQLQRQRQRPRALPSRSPCSADQPVAGAGGGSPARVGARPQQAHHRGGRGAPGAGGPRARWACPTRPWRWWTPFSDSHAERGRDLNLPGSW
jgi:hypothetical protein